MGLTALSEVTRTPGAPPSTRPDHRQPVHRTLGTPALSRPRACSGSLVTSEPSWGSPEWGPSWLCWWPLSPRQGQVWPLDMEPQGLTT